MVRPREGARASCQLKPTDAPAQMQIDDSGRWARVGSPSAVKFWTEAACDSAGRQLGSLPLRALRTSHVLTALATRPDLTGKTVNNYVSPLREALDLAVTDKLLSDNPVTSVKRAKHQKPPPDPFEREEAEAIVAHMDKTQPAQITNLVEFWLWTGMRTSEVFALTWSSVDLRKGAVLVAQALVRGKLKDTKTSTVRTVILNSRALAAIKRQKEHTFLAGKEVFQDPRYASGWTDERAFRRSYWIPSLKRLGLRYRRPYNMRHTYATAMLMAGMTPAFCARQLGHSIEMFLRTYSKWIDGEQNDLEMRRLEASLANSSLVLPQEHCQTEKTHINQ